MLFEKIESKSIQSDMLTRHSNRHEISFLVNMIGLLWERNQMSRRMSKRIMDVLISTRRGSFPCVFTSLATGKFAPTCTRWLHWVDQLFSLCNAHLFSVSSFRQSKGDKTGYFCTDHFWWCYQLRIDFIKDRRYTQTSRSLFVLFSINTERVGRFRSVYLSLHNESRVHRCSPSGHHWLFVGSTR